MQTPSYPSTSAFDELPIPADQRAQLKAFAATLRAFDLRPPASAAAAAELMTGTTRSGEGAGASASSSSGVTISAAPANSRAMLLIIAADLTLGEGIAKALAQELARDLLPVDLSRVVSKFIAETEKHLEELFDVAGADGDILFFDDADALFGRDGQASESHFADQEVGYLLHHIEGFNGVSVLAVHAATPIDPEVLKRFTCVIRG